jgi:hypothetical protein
VVGVEEHIPQVQEVQEVGVLVLLKLVMLPCLVAEQEFL